jgi:dolichyl-phosphate beta-glucosyltransferase
LSYQQAEFKVNQPSFSLIIPVHNEAVRLPQTLKLLSDFCSTDNRTYEIIVVENASSDATLQIAQDWLAQLKIHKVLVLKEPGKGKAIRAGMLAASGAQRVMLDADLSMSADQIPALLQALDRGADIAIASREAAGAQRVGEPLIRHLIGRVFNYLVRFLVLPGIQDTQCGFKAFTAQAAQEVFARQSLDGWCFDVEILAIARRLGYKVQEVPITWAYYPGSKVRIWRDSWLMLRDLLKIRKNLHTGVYDQAKV